MSVLIIFIKLIAVFDLLVIAVYFGGDILSTMLNKLRRKPKQDDPFDFSLDTVTVSLSIDSIRQLCSDDAADFVEEKILPNAEKTMAVLTEQEQTAARLLLSALIGFLAAEAPMDEQSFPLMMELLNCMEGEKEDGCQDAVDSLLEDAACNTRRHEEYYSNYQRYQLMQVDNRPVVSTVLKTPAAKRDIPIPKCLVDCLREAKENSISDYVIADSKGEPLAASQFQRVWQYVVVRSTKPRNYYKYVNGESIKYTVTPTLGMTQKNQPKIKYTLDFDVTPHQLRHTYITNLLYAGVDPKTVQYLAGHENSKTTMDIYAKVKYNKPEELFDVVNQAFIQDK